MSTKAFLKFLFAASAAFNLPASAATPQETKRESSALERWEAANARRAATALLEEIRLVDAAVDQWAIEFNKPAGAMPTPQELALYAKKGTRLHAELAAGRLNDALGNSITLCGVDSVPLISKASVQQFASVVQPGFWGPYYEGPELSTAPAPDAAPANPVTKAELQTTAIRLLEEMRIIDAAIDQWAIENNKQAGDQPRASDLIVYIKKGTRLHGALAGGRLNDSLGNPIVIPPVDEIPTISEATAKRLAGVVPEDFWGPFAKKKKAE